MPPTTLRTAIGSNDLASFERLIAEGAALEDGEAQPLLEAAAFSDRGRMVRRLLEAGADASGARLALNWAAYHGDVLSVQALLAGGAPERESDHEMGPGSKRGFPLACAARGGSLPCVTLLSERLPRGDGETEALTEVAIGIGIDARDQIDGARREASLAVIDHLVRRGGDCTELAHATVAHTSQLWLLERALDAGVSPQAVVNATGHTLLHVAAQRLAHRMIGVLLARGASREARDVHGATPFDLARSVIPASTDERSAQRLCLTSLGDAPPETTRASSAAPARGALRAGARVRHPAHGLGTVLSVTAELVRVRFSATLTLEVPSASITVA